MRRLLPTMLLCVTLLALWSCHEERHSFVANVGQLVPTMATTDVSTFISDSGYTRYHIITPLWEMYENAPDPFWRFPQGLHMEQYDEAMRPAADVTCDSATYLSRRRIWQLDGNVVMVNTQRDSFLTQQLFWDQHTRKVYSDSFIHIVRADRIIEGYGFESNQNMTSYSVNRPTGIFAARRPEDTPAPDVDEDDNDGFIIDTSAAAGQYAPPGRRHAPTRASVLNRASSPDSFPTPTFVQ